MSNDFSEANMQTISDEIHAAKGDRHLSMTIFGVDSEGNFISESIEYDSAIKLMPEYIGGK